MDPVIAERIDAIDTTVRELTASLDREQRLTEQNEKMRDFAPGERWAYAPESERVKALKTIIAEQDARASEALSLVESAIRDDEPSLAEIVATLKRAPTVLQALVQEHPDPPIGLRLNAQILDELQLQRFTRELDGARPGTVLAAYEEAVHARDVAVLRFIERRHAPGWPAASGSAADAQAAQALARRIAETQEARVPRDVREWEEAVRRARKAVTVARELHQVRPRNRETRRAS